MTRKELTVKLPKQPVVKTAIHAKTQGITSAASPADATPVAGSSLMTTASAIGGTTTATTSTHQASTTNNSSVHSGQKSPTTPSEVLQDAIVSDLSTAKGSATSTVTTTTTTTTTSPSSTSPSSVAVKAHGRDLSSSSSASSASGAVTGVTSTSTTITTTPIAGAGSAGAVLAPNQLSTSFKTPGVWTQPYFLEQIKDIQNHLAQALFPLEDFWTLASFSSSSSPASPTSSSCPKTSCSPPRSIELPAVQTLLQHLQRHLRGAIENLARPSREKLYPFRVCDPKIFTPPLSEDFVLEFYIRDAKVVCAAYALQLSSPPPPPPSSGSGFGFGGGNGSAAIYHALLGDPHYHSQQPQQPLHQHQQQQQQSSLPQLQPPPLAATSPAFLGHHHHQRAYSHPGPSLASLAPSSAPEVGGMEGALTTETTAVDITRARPSPRRSPSTSYFMSGGAASGTGAGNGAGSSWSGLTSTGAKSPPLASAHMHQQQQQGSKSGGASPGTTPAATVTVASQGKASSTNYLSMLSGFGASDGSAPLALDKIGLTSKGGINKYRGKIATTLEDVMVQVQDPRLDDIRSRLVHAEALCLDLSSRLQVFVQ
ncbi:hypothetical protein BGZ73_003062 [Actinomortierella ambigua]|nr:hypothetical protein BGZ73_003062 [Actinomortierella ambigua]